MEQQSSSFQNQSASKADTNQQGGQEEYRFSPDTNPRMLRAYQDIKPLNKR
jgi:hypothetical protein